MLAPGTPIGRYVIKKKLAEGGMAEIFLATATGPEGFEKEVAIKVVKSFLAEDQAFVDMFVAEARLASKLNHANLVQIFDFGKHEDRYYLAMEYVRGASLFDLRRRCKVQGTPFPPTLAGELVAQVARGLQFAHTLTERGTPLGLVHRDVTPQNILLSFDGAVKLTDFGIAKATSSHTAPGTLKGKFAYMSPEQARGDPVDARTDIFALGIVFWELLTGGHLFAGDSDVAVLRSVQNCIIVPPSRLNPEVPDELSEIVLKALAREPGDRWPSAFAFERALSGWVIKTAQAVEDTSVAIFVQGLYREEYDADRRQASSPAVQAVARRPQTEPDDIAHGDTLALNRAGASEMAATHPSSKLPQLQPRAGEDADATLPPKVRTEQMPSLRNLPGVRPSMATPLPGPVMGTPPPRSAFAGPLEEPPPNTTERMQTLPQQQPATRAARPAPPPPSATEPAPKRRSLVPFFVILVGLVGLAGLGIRLLTHGSLVGDSTPDTTEQLADTRLDGPGELAAAPADSRTGAPSAPAEAAAAQRPDSAPPAVAAAEATPHDVAARPEAGPPDTAKAPEAPKQAEPVAPVKVQPPEAPEKEPAPSHPVHVKRPTGTLVVRAKPFAVVSVGGRKDVEVMGVHTFTLPAGTWSVLLQHPKKTKTEKVTVRPGQTTTLDFNAQ